MKRPCQNLSHRQRERTPLPFARYLVERVQAMHPSERVAVLWACKWSLYRELYPLTDCWGVHRNAKFYPGPWPVIYHPPCGPWGKLKWSSRQSLEDGILAIDFVHRYGGVVEQPVGSQLFNLHGRAGTIETVNQGDFGHLAVKATLLYFAHREGTP